MTCHMCSSPIVIETDPKNDDYRIVSGGRRKEEVWKVSLPLQFHAPRRVERFRILVASALC
jgi:hypothetical protein